ncbi:response regulator transcription factor [Enterococcus sp. BWM-S5]|uniref:Response regulator transcription factor n=1 Tax=Enterococcus larvae TaxID=2794352 RepID=A0ABS4CPB0_9ENTE|nr:winged helix-turn-helix domain-containing protein [Enterococcus larvae]MBP1048393.1 response regulator transcription factor [Enterococcus larvae]
MKAGIINLSADFAESYSKKLEKNNIHVIPLALDDFEQKISELDAVIVREIAVEDTVQTCSILIKLKEKTNADVWVFSSTPQKITRTVYLQLGALGILSEECDEDELQLIISNSLCRKGNKSDDSLRDGIDQEPDQAVQKLKLIPQNHGVQILGEKEITLTTLEYKVISLLYNNRNNVVTYGEIYERVWQKKYNNQKYRVANLIYHLREKMEDNPNGPSFIRTIRSKGYMLDLLAI